MKKIVLIAPVPPFKGGISHFNYCLSKELGKKYELTVISYKLRFPAILYPGKSQIEEGSKDIIRHNQDVFMINSLNPLNWIKVILKIKKLKPDIVIYNWVTPFLGHLITFLSGFSKAFIGNQNILICHNVIPHESGVFDRILTRMAFSNIDRFIVHAENEKNELKNQIKSNKEVISSFHPDYNFFKAIQNKVDLTEVAGGTGKKKLLYFGIVREYKGLKYLIKAVSELNNRKNYSLLIAGEFWDDVADYKDQIERLGIAEQCTLLDKYIEDKEVGNFFDWADLVVLPYVSATQSGIAKIAIAFNKPVVLTKVGGLPDLKETYPDLVHLVDASDSKAIKDSIEEYFASEKEHPNISVRDNEKDSWDLYVKLLID